MNPTSSPRSIDELARLVEELLEHLQTLVAAVDDLRQEVEWWARNASVEATCRLAGVSRPDNQPAQVAPEASVAARERPRSAREALAMYERTFQTRLATYWSGAQEFVDAAELPLGKVLRVELAWWYAVLADRPAHMVGGECDCELGEGAPFLLAWRHTSGAFLLELADDEARELQRLCLAAQEEARARALPAQALPSPSQRQLW